MIAPRTANEIATYIAARLDREQDESFKRMLVVPMDAWYSTLVSRSLEKHPMQRSFFRQTIWMPMELVNPVSCDTKVPLCKVARSKHALPASPLRFGNELFDYVGSIDGNHGFRQSDPGTGAYLSRGKYSKNIERYEYINRHIQVASNRNIPMIRIDGVFDSPGMVAEFNCSNGNDCDWWDKAYPATQDIIQMMIQYILTVDYQQPNVPETREIEVNPLVPKNKYEA